jgi:hypothetical protein
MQWPYSFKNKVENSPHFVQAADFAQGERNLSFRRQSGMAAGEDQTEAIVLKAALFIGLSAELDCTSRYRTSSS